MAGEWLKFECSLPEKPETMAITAAMGWDDTDLTVGKLMRLFRWFDQQTLDGNAAGVTSALLDKVIGVTGFVQAVVNVRWMTVTETGLALHNFERHNGATAKSRALTATRVANHRAEQQSNQQLIASNAPPVTKPLAREEKRREEKKESLLPGFARFWDAWPRSERKEARGKCHDVWVKAKAEPHADRIVAHVERLKVSRSWTKDGGEFIPAPLAYLNQKKWEGTEDAATPEKCPEWCRSAGFVNVHEAGNAGCYEHTAEQFHDGQRIEAHA